MLANPANQQAAHNARIWRTDVELLCGGDGQVGDELRVLVQPQAGHLVHREVRGVGVELDLDLVHQLQPVPLPHRLILQVGQQGQRPLELLHVVLQLDPHVPRLEVPVGEGRSSRPRQIQIQIQISIKWGP